MQARDGGLGELECMNWPAASNGIVVIGGNGSACFHRHIYCSQNRRTQSMNVGYERKVFGKGVLVGNSTFLLHWLRDVRT